MAESARLVWLDRTADAVVLPLGRPLRIGRDPGSDLCLADEPGLSRHHAELRPAGPGAWLLCDLGSSNGTFLEGERLEGCRPLVPGARFRLGRRGPQLQFLAAAITPRTAKLPNPGAPPRATRNAPGAGTAGRRPGASPTASRSADLANAPGAAPLAVVGSGRAEQAAREESASITVAGQRLAVGSLREVETRSEALHPHAFSWWVPACLGGLLWLPVPVVFWPWQALALAGAVLLGRRREHSLILTLRDGRALRHGFADRATAEAVAQGVRRAMAAQAPASAAPGP